MKSDRSSLKKYATVGASAGAGFLVAWLLFHSDKKVEYREQVKVEYVDRVEYKDRIVEKVVKDVSSSRQQNVRVITKYIERPDGTKEMTKEEVTDTKEDEKSKTVADKTQETEIKREVVIQKEVQIEKVETPVSKDWHLSASVGLTSSVVPLYGAQLEKRVLGPIYLGVKADTNPSVSIVAGFDF
jgi:hypothetical protein